MSELRMPEINEVRIAGRLVRDAETRSTTTGANIMEFSIAVDRSWKDKSTGDRLKDVSYHSVQTWNPPDYLARELTKGRPVYVEGELTQDTWVDKETQKKRERTRIRARRVILLDWLNDKDDDIPF